jgi:hypothetical protein
MVSRKFRHLPVLADSDDSLGTSEVAGLLDITKCVFERLEDLERKVNDDLSILTAMAVLERRGAVDGETGEHVRKSHGCPDLNYVLGDHSKCPSVGIKVSVREAAKKMKECHSTAVLVLDEKRTDDRPVAGIFTCKDITLRVIAASLDASTTSVVRVMTPHPDFCNGETSILDALKKLRGLIFLI